jgi:uncharacterized protein (DUF2141 family)
MHPRLTLFSILVALLLGAALPSAQAEGAAIVTVSVSNVRAQRGAVMAALYAESWESRPLATARAAAAGDSVTLTLAAPTSGRYAVRVFHDVNGDGRLGTNLIGIPSEPTGASNNAPPRFGPPTFEGAAFDVGAAGASVAIALR